MWTMKGKPSACPSTLLSSGGHAARRGRLPPPGRSEGRSLRLRRRRRRRRRSDRLPPASSAPSPAVLQTGTTIGTCSAAAATAAVSTAVSVTVSATLPTVPTTADGGAAAHGCPRPPPSPSRVPHTSPHRRRRSGRAPPGSASAEAAPRGLLPLTGLRVSGPAGPGRGVWRPTTYGFRGCGPGVLCVLPGPGASGARFQPRLGRRARVRLRGQHLQRDARATRRPPRQTWTCMMEAESDDV